MIFSESYTNKNETESKIFLGRFTNYFHGIKGDVYSIQNKKFLIENFEYDGTGPDTFFLTGPDETEPSISGTVLTYPFNGQFYDYNDSEIPNMNRFDQETVELVLPDNIEIENLKWLSVWCRAFHINFGDLKFN